MPSEAGLLIVGKQAAEALGKVGLPAIDPLRLVHADTEHGPVLLLTPAAGQVPVFELRGDDSDDRCDAECAAGPGGLGGGA